MQKLKKMKISQTILYLSNIVGWGIITYITIFTFIHKGNITLNINMFGEMWLEVIVIPLFLVILIILTFYYISNYKLYFYTDNKTNRENDKNGNTS